MAEKNELLDELKNAIIKGERKRAPDIAEKALVEGSDIQEVLKSMGDGMGVVGNKFEKREYMLPDMLLSAYTFKLVFQNLEERIKEGVERSGTSLGKIIFATVKNDIHDIGKDLVVAFLRGAGYEVYDLGVDVPAEDIIEEAEKVGADVIALSALLTPTRKELQAVIGKLEEKGLRDKYKVMVGGAPVSQKYADMIGADGYAEEASMAVGKAKEVMRG